MNNYQHTPEVPFVVSMNAYTPQQTTEICSRVGTKKANMSIDKIFFSSFIAGCYLAFSSSVCLVINTSPWVRMYKLLPLNHF